MPPLHAERDVLTRTRMAANTTGGKGRLEFHCDGSLSSAPGSSSSATSSNIGTPTEAPFVVKDQGQGRTNNGYHVDYETIDMGYKVVTTPSTEAAARAETCSPTFHSHQPLSLSTDGKVVLKWWISGIITLGVLVWILNVNVIAVVGAALSIPILAIVQGAIAIVWYRVKYGNCPLPKAPSHGIVRVEPNNDIGGEPCCMRHAVDEHSSEEERDRSEANRLPPLRLLVIGDSLAVGVGQSSSSTPLMPETIAKSLSKEMGGRPVLWTCHGAPGASAGWIVRELERSIKEGTFQQRSSSLLNDDIEASMSYLNLDMEGIKGGPMNATTMSMSGLVGATVSEESDSASADDSFEINLDLGEERGTWQERLREERVHFDPNRVGPFDIAVVLTGSNDLKSAFFPFLLSGEDAKFRQEAQQHGGGYGKELTRILQALKQGMRLRLETLKDSVEEATQKMRVRLGSMDSVSTHQSGYVSQRMELDSTGRTAQHAMEEDSATGLSISSSPASLFPMVVLPGLPARALPVFSVAPLRWLAVPIVDIMDSHKRRLARRHRGEVIFVDAPTPEQITEYVDGEGEYRKQEKQDNVLLELRDIKTRHARQIESDMKDYFFPEQLASSKKPSQWNRHHDVFSVDGIHPNDVGYEFWGRHIAHHIVQDWQRTKKTLPLTR